MARLGFVCFGINYRKAPRRPHPAQIDDCEAALLWIAEHAAEFTVDTDRLAAWGYSAGGHLVALLGCRPRGCATAVRLRCVVAGGMPCGFYQHPPNDDMLSYFLGGTRASCGSAGG